MAEVDSLRRRLCRSAASLPRLQRLLSQLHPGHEPHQFHPDVLGLSCRRRHRRPSCLFSAEANVFEVPEGIHAAEDLWLRSGCVRGDGRPQLHHQPAVSPYSLLWR